MKKGTADERRFTRMSASRVSVLIRVHLWFVLTLALCLCALVIEASPFQTQTAADPNRYVVIISGASGEPAYAKQFQQWTTTLQAALSGRFGFPKNRVKVLTEKATGATAPATAEEVRKM